MLVIVLVAALGVAGLTFALAGGGDGSEPASSAEQVAAPIASAESAGEPGEDEPADDQPTPAATGGAWSGGTPPDAPQYTPAEATGFDGKDGDPVVCRPGPRGSARTLTLVTDFTAGTPDSLAEYKPGPRLAARQQLEVLAEYGDWRFVRCGNDAGFVPVTNGAVGPNKRVLLVAEGPILPARPGALEPSHEPGVDEFGRVLCKITGGSKRPIVLQSEPGGGADAGPIVKAGDLVRCFRDELEPERQRHVYVARVRTSPADPVAAGWIDHFKVDVV